MQWGTGPASALYFHENTKICFTRSCLLPLKCVDVGSEVHCAVSHIAVADVTVLPTQRKHARQMKSDKPTLKEREGK